MQANQGAVSNGPMTDKAVSWMRAAGLSCLAMYGPFTVMAIYALLFVSCDHCKRTAWTILPCAPGLFPIEIGRKWLDLPRPDDTLTFAMAFIIAVALVFGLACVIRRGRWWCIAGMAIAIAVFSPLAFSLLSAIRA